MYQFGIGFKNGNQEYPIHKSTNKYKTESFDDYFPTRKDNSYKIKHVMDWLGLFVYMHNRELIENIVKSRV
jgi:hypothetical protein